MFDQVMKRSNWVWIYKMGRFAEERRAFLCDLNEQGHSVQTLRNVNRFLLAIAERVNVRQSVQVSEVQIVRAAGSWAAKSCAPHSKAETREAAAKRFVYVAKNWLRFLGKWQDPERNPQLRAELDSFLRTCSRSRQSLIVEGCARRSIRVMSAVVSLSRFFLFWRAFANAPSLARSTSMRCSARCFTC